MKNRSDRKRKAMVPKEPMSVLKVYVAKNEHDKIKASASSIGKSITDYCSELIFNGKIEIIEKHNPLTIKAICSLTTSFNNLNQIAKHLNQGNKLDTAIAIEISNLKNIISKTLNND